MKNYTEPQTLVALVLTDPRVIQMASSRRSVTLSGPTGEGDGSGAN